MNKVLLKGHIRNIQDSHQIGDIQYSQAQLIVPRDDNKEDIINVKFKKFTFEGKEGDLVSLEGNLRTYSQKLEDKNKVSLYVYTYFDIPDLDEYEDLKEKETFNYVELDGFICKKSEARKTKNGKDIIDFIIANNLETSTKMLNCYIPSVTWGKNAKKVNEMKIGDKITVKGRLQSREYKKYISDTEYEIRVAYELSIAEIL